MIIALKIIALAFSLFLASLGGWVRNSEHSSNHQFWTITVTSIVIGLVAVLA